MEILLVFLAGYAFCAWGVSFLDSLVNTIIILFQLIQEKMAVTIAEDAAKITKLKQDSNIKVENDETCAIGFVIPTEGEDEEEYDDY